jgi:DNA gyrase subunit A
VTTTHHWILFFTNKGRVYRAKAYELPEAGRDARGQHVANLLAFQPDEKIAQVLAIDTYNSSDFLVIATLGGLVKKTALSEYDSNRSGGLIAINLRPNDEVVSAVLVGERDDLLLVSKKAMSLRFTADDEALRPMGRSTSGVIGMKFRAGDELLAMDRVIENGKLDVFTATDGGYAKRTPVEEYRVQGRGGLGIKAAKIDEESRGTLVGALIVSEEDEVLAITSAGTVMRTPAAEVRRTGRDTMGVRLVNLTDETVVVSIARNAESEGGEVSEVSEVVE